MKRRPIHIYRVDFDWPSEADRYQWGRRIYRVNYLTPAGASWQARRLRERGAVVTIRRSLPVKWPEVPDGV